MLRQPLQVLLIFGCLVSALASGRFSPRLILDGAISFAFVPIFDGAALAIVARVRMRRRCGVLPLIEAFADAYRPWTFLMIAVMAIAVITPPRQIAGWFWPVVIMASCAAALAARAEFRCFRRALQRSPREAFVDVLLHRAIAWTAITTCFFGIAVWYSVVPRLAAAAGWR